MVARVDHGMIRLDGLSRRGPQMSATPDSTLADPQQIIADLQRKLKRRNESTAKQAYCTHWTTASPKKGNTSPIGSWMVCGATAYYPSRP
jgi:hypothetical protein